jgi:hypothetical protein
MTHVHDQLHRYPLSILPPLNSDMGPSDMYMNPVMAVWAIRSQDRLDERSLT